MPGLSYPCVCCHAPAEDEYHWWHEGQEIVWRLCGECCEFAVDVVEIVSNLETEVEAWIRSGK